MSATFVLLSIAMIVVIPLFALTRYRAAGVICASLAVLAASTRYAPGFVIFQSAVTFALCSLCVMAKGEYRGVLKCSIAAGCVTWLLVGIAEALTPYGWLERRQQLRDAYPLESIADRLQYESPMKDEDKAKLPQLDKSVEARLVRWESRESVYDGREYFKVDRIAALERIHDKELDEFIRRQGFGAFRMRRVQEEDLIAKDPGPVRFDPEPPIPVTGKLPTSEQLEKRRLQPLPKQDWAGLLGLHMYGLEDFLDPNRIGYVKDRDHVAGFISHRFERMPTETKPVDEFDTEAKQPQRKWRITKLELISLLKHKEPVAYLSEHLPRMDELKEARTRPLTDFETAAVKKLRREEDVIVRDAGDRVLMVGSVRAAKSCMQCHSVRRGDLLGAFSYELFPEPHPVNASSGKKSASR